MSPRVSLERKKVTSWVVRSANKNKCPEEDRVHSRTCMIDMGMGAEWALKRDKKEAGQMVRAFTIQNNHAEEFAFVPEWKFLFFIFFF